MSHPVDEHDPNELAQLFEIYLEGLLHLKRLSKKEQTQTLINIAMVFNRRTVDYCTECTPACPLYAICTRTTTTPAREARRAVPSTPHPESRL